MSATAVMVNGQFSSGVRSSRVVLIDGFELCKVCYLARMRVLGQIFVAVPAAFS